MGGGGTVHSHLCGTKTNVSLSLGETEDENVEMWQKVRKSMKGEDCVGGGRRLGCGNMSKGEEEGGEEGGACLLAKPHPLA